MRKASIAAVVALTAIIADPSFAQEKMVVIEGLVLDEADQPIKGVLVRAYRAGRPLAENRTSEDGSYLLQIPSGSYVELLRYDHSSWFPKIVPGISGQHGSRINAVLIRPGTALSNAVALEQLHAYERAFYLDTSGDYDPNILAAYKKNLGSLNVPVVLAPRATQVGVLYGVWPAVYAPTPVSGMTGDASPAKSQAGFWMPHEEDF